MNTRRLAHILTIMLMLAYTGIAAACPMCKDSIPNSDAQDAAGLPSGFNFSIYYMLVSLFAVMGGFGYFVFRTIRATDQAKPVQGFPAHPNPRTRIV